MKIKKILVIILIFVLCCNIVVPIVKATEDQNKTEVNNLPKNEIKQLGEEKEHIKIQEEADKKQSTETKTEENIPNSLTEKNQITNDNKVIQDEDILIEYEYKKATNTVLATVKSKKEMKPTKASWKLSADKKQYTFEFNRNTKYTTNFTNIDGKIIPVEINIEHIDESPAKLTITYEYKQATNTVVATLKSNRELQATKISWKLSTDKKQYTFEFEGNTKYVTNFTDIYENIIPIEINVTQVKKIQANIKIEYEYKQTTNTVLATVKSDIQLQPTKVSWKLSADKKQYTFEFEGNTKYVTNFTDIYGNIIPVEINVNQINETKMNISYNYKEDTNTVIVTVTSNNQFKPTKGSWKLSADKKQYTFEFNDNTKYTTSFSDIYGKVIDININVNQIDKEAPEILVKYILNKDGTVTVSLNSNEKLGDTKPTWTLSNDKLSYKKTFNNDNKYSTEVRDIHGNLTIVNLDFKIRKFTYKQSDNSIITVKYLYKERTEAEVQITSSVKLQNTKPNWKLSADGYTYTTNFYSNNIYVTQIKDINGATKDVNIIVNLFGNYLNGIDVSEHQGKINWVQVKNSGVDFAILRCGYGQDSITQDDSYFMRNVMECERLGIPYGVYLYSYALNEQGAYSEVNHVLRLIKGHNPTFGVWIDMEDADGYKLKNGMPSDETLVNICDIFCQEIQKKGYKSGIYASLNWFDSKLSSNLLDKHNKWVAQWNSSCTYNKRYVMWQYTSSGSVDGILTSVDMNIYYR